MSGFDLLNNYTDNLEALLRKSQSRIASSSATPLAVELVIPLPSTNTEMAKSLRDWLVLQNFYEGLTPMSKGHIDAAARGAFLSLTIDGAKALIEKIVANQSWGEECKQPKGMHFVKEVDMLAAKIDLLMKRLDDHAAKKEAMKSTRPWTHT